MPVQSGKKSKSVPDISTETENVHKCRTADTLEKSTETEDLKGDANENGLNDAVAPEHPILPKYQSRYANVENEKCLTKLLICILAFVCLSHLLLPTYIIDGWRVPKQNVSVEFKTENSIGMFTSDQFLIKGSAFFFSLKKLRIFVPGGFVISRSASIISYFFFPQISNFIFVLDAALTESLILDCVVIRFNKPRKYGTGMIFLQTCLGYAQFWKRGKRLGGLFILPLILFTIISCTALIVYESKMHSLLIFLFPVIIRLNLAYKLVHQIGLYNIEIGNKNRVTPEAEKKMKTIEEIEKKLGGSEPPAAPDSDV